VAGGRPDREHARRRHRIPANREAVFKVNIAERNEPPPRSMVVGSVLVRRLLDAPDVDTGIAELAALCGELADGVRSGSTATM
jgi:hypothetical protein